MVSSPRMVFSHLLVCTEAHRVKDFNQHESVLSRVLEGGFPMILRMRLNVRIVRGSRSASPQSLDTESAFGNPDRSECSDAEVCLSGRKRLKADDGTLFILVASLLM